MRSQEAEEHEKSVGENMIPNRTFFPISWVLCWVLPECFTTEQSTVEFLYLLVLAICSLIKHAKKSQSHWLTRQQLSISNWTLAKLSVSSCFRERNDGLNRKKYTIMHMIFHIIICILHLPRIYYDLTKWPAPRWLDRSIGRVLHRNRKGDGFELISLLISLWPGLFSGFNVATS